MKIIKKYSILSLFSGCGGLDLGFLGNFSYLGKKYSKRNFHIIWSNDINKNACLTYEKNFNEKIVCGDITKIVKGTLPDLFCKPLPKKVDIVLGGFPCQDFSVAGKRRGLDFERGNLYKSMIKVIKKTKPTLFLAENVKGILSINNGTAIKIIKKDFEAIGYDVEYRLFHVANYGVPENRERVIIVGLNKEKNLPSFEFPKLTHSKDEWIPVEKAISDLEGKKEGEVVNHFWSKAKYFPGKQGNSKIKKDKIAPTMRAEHHGKPIVVASKQVTSFCKKILMNAPNYVRIEPDRDNSTKFIIKKNGNTYSNILPGKYWEVYEFIKILGL